MPQLVKKKEKVIASNVTKLEMEFFIKTLLLDIEEQERLVFRFQLEELGAHLTVKQQHLAGRYYCYSLTGEIYSCSEQR